MKAGGYRGLIARVGWMLGIGVILVAVTSIVSHAQAPASDFSLQVTPSPLVTTVKPGQTTNLELKIRNAGTGTESLKIEPRKFTVDKKTGEIAFDDTATPEIAPWVSFSSPTFSVKPGEWSTENVKIALPKESGFSYSFVLVISRTNNQKTIESGRLINGSVAVFTLVNVDRPGATRKLDITDFKPTQAVYEYLPADFNVSFRNTGNTIVQPYGNVFVQRSSGDTAPIATLPVNEKGGYLLPESPRELKVHWDKGFPVFKAVTKSDGSTGQDLAWDWSKLSDFRIGPYTAKLVAIYNDGQRDVPIEREVTFWVIPWRSILILIAVIGLIVFIRHRQIERKTRKAVKRALDERDKKKETPDAK
ncbi:MAG: hypothetical protein JWN75_923 [Candidatus Saccharibacteria bacterium]|nr:hypothetical protein [Candidatus Saccharibacteria bacterium]